MSDFFNNLNSSMISEIVKNTSSSSLNRLIAAAFEELKQRLIEEQDLELLIDIAMKKGFDGGGNPLDPFEIAPGIIALASTVKQTSSTRHTCTHYTVRADKDIPDEYWSFDKNSDTLLISETNNVEKIRTSVALHAMPSGSAVFRHTMVHDGERHNRKGSRAWVIDLVFDEETNLPSAKIKSDAGIKPSKLPSPND